MQHGILCHEFVQHADFVDAVIAEECSERVFVRFAQPTRRRELTVVTAEVDRFRLGDQSGTTPFVNTSAFELSRWRGGRYRVYTLKRRWSLEELTVQRYDDVDMNGDTSSTSMNINNCLIAQLLFLQ